MAQRTAKESPVCCLASVSELMVFESGEREFCRSYGILFDGAPKCELETPATLSGRTRDCVLALSCGIMRVSHHARYHGVRR
jgi:hypothetical protein